MVEQVAVEDVDAVEEVEEDLGTLAAVNVEDDCDAGTFQARTASAFNCEGEESCILEPYPRSLSDVRLEVERFFNMGWSQAYCTATETSLQASVAARAMVSRKPMLRN